MKRWFVVVLSLVLILAVASPVYAAGPRPARGTFTLVGEISALDESTKQVTVHVLQGNILVKAYIGKDVTLATTASTRYLLNDGLKTVVISFTDLKVGDKVSVNGSFSGGVWTAARITVGAKLIHY